MSLIFRKLLLKVPDIAIVPRRSRIIIPNTPHHVTQRGSRRGDVFFDSHDRILYLKLLKRYSDTYGVEIIAYCLMNNHVHHILVPNTGDGLAKTLAATHMRYACVINGRNNWTGHLWQQRYFSSPLDEKYFWAALRYVEQNPVRADISKDPWSYPWSSARSHCKLFKDPYLSQNQRWVDAKKRITDWKAWLSAGNKTEEEDFLRSQTARGRPSGEEPFLKKLEEDLNIQLMPGRQGRPENRGQMEPSPINVGRL